MPAERLEHIAFSGIREVFEECRRLEADGRDVVHLETGRPDFDTPEPIKEAGIRAIADGRVHYTSNYGIEPLRERIAEKFATENGIEYDPDGELVVTTGATEAVFVTVLSLVDPGGEVLVPDPCWTYETAIRSAGGVPVYYDLDPATGFQPDPDSIADAVSTDTQLLIVNSPHNPTGGVVDADRARAIRDLAVEHDLAVLSDEIYEKIVYDGRKHHSLAALDGMFDRTVTVNGFSKAYSMTGWRLGYLGAPEHLVDALIRIRQYTTTCAPSISQHAGVRALEGSLHEPMVEQFAERRRRVLERLEAIPGMECPTPYGAFYVLPTLPSGWTDDREFAFSLLREAAVALVPGRVFGPAGEGRVRIAYSNSMERVDEAFDRLEAWLAT